jgi:hypothetical protein
MANELTRNIGTIDMVAMGWLWEEAASAGLSGEIHSAGRNEFRGKIFHEGHKGVMGQPTDLTGDCSRIERATSKQP